MVFFNKSLSTLWVRFWMRYAGLNFLGRVASRFVAYGGVTYKDAAELAYNYSNGFFSPYSTFPKKEFSLGKHVFVDDRVTIFRKKDGGPIVLKDKVVILRDSILETEQGGGIEVGEGTWIHQKCNLVSAIAPIIIGTGVMLAARCSLYPHNHSIKKGTPIAAQPANSKGPILIGDDAWLGTGVIVLSGVNIGKGAVIGAGAVVTDSIPENAVAAGVPAKVIKMRAD